MRWTLRGVRRADTPVSRSTATSAGARRVPEQEQAERNADDDVEDAAPSRVRLELALPPCLFEVAQTPGLARRRWRRWPNVAPGMVPGARARAHTQRRTASGEAARGE